jgi:hypothetical protein
MALTGTDFNQPGEPVLHDGSRDLTAHGRSLFVTLSPLLVVAVYVRSVTVCFAEQRFLIVW